MEHICFIFFGSTDDSVVVLDKLFQSQLSQVTLSICCVVTQPPRPVGRKQAVTPTPVEIWTKEHNLPVLSFASNTDKPWLYADESQVIDSLEPFKADLVISACYGQKIPRKTFTDARFGGLNVHPSLLPRWRGADPVPWAILSGDHQTGVSVVTLSEKFDEGRVIAQKKLPIVSTDTSDALRTKLFTIGADLLGESLDSVIASEAKQSHRRLPRPLRSLAMTPSSYARRLTRVDGYESWETLQKSFLDPDEAIRIDRKFRAFSPWPGIWTDVAIQAIQATQASPARPETQKKRLKILTCHLDPVSGLLNLDTVQLEGKKPVSWKQFVSAHIPMQRSN